MKKASSSDRLLSSARRRFNGLTARERKTFFAAAAAILLLAADGLLWSPQIEKVKRSKAAVFTAQAAKTAADFSRDKLTQEVASTGKEAVAKETASLREEISKADRAIATLPNAAMTSERLMAAMADMRSSSNGNIRRISLVADPVASPSNRLHPARIEITSSGDWALFSKLLSKMESEHPSVKLESLSIDKTSNGEKRMSASFSAFNVDKAIGYDRKK